MHYCIPFFLANTPVLIVLYCAVMHMVAC